jgi:hypothetical protein
MVIDGFADIIVPRGSLICIACMACPSLHGKLPNDAEEHLVEAPIDSFLSRSILKSCGETRALCTRTVLRNVATSLGYKLPHADMVLKEFASTQLALVSFALRW